jgi:alanine or glycine:cation symporter, AGCS family
MTSENSLITWLNDAAAQLAAFMWGEWFVWLLLGTHVFLTLRTGFVQRHLYKAIRISFSREKEGEGDVSQFAALMTALAATIGTGNIAGVAGAIAAGGPGAVFWMWITGVLGIATKFSEALLAVKYRVRKPDGSYAGGPMYALERGLGMKPLGLAFALFTMLAAFGIGCMAQAESLVSLLLGNLTPVGDGGFTVFGSTVARSSITITAGIVLAGITAVVILGGVKSISRVCELLVPVMAIGYVLGCIALLIHNAGAVPSALAQIWDGAWSGTAAVGGFIGVGIKEAITKGVARGLFSNESGLGSAPIVAAAAQTRNAVRQALVSSTGTFWDTVVVCAMTGVVLVSSGHWDEGLDKTALTQAAFADLGTWGPRILLFGMATFVFSTILGWCYYGERAAEYLIGARAVMPYRLAWVVAVYLGCVWKSSAVWDFSDAMNALMALPNLVALLLLSGVIAREAKAAASER